MESNATHCGNQDRQLSVDNTLAIHPDFKSVKGRRYPFSRTALAFSATLLTAINALHRRKFKHIVTLTKIPGLDGNTVPVHIIRPEKCAQPAPALLYYPGGAYIYKHAPPHLENAVRYAREAGCCVVFVEYRLAPKHVFPAGFNDCYAALRWTLLNSAKLGIDPQRIAVAGDSAGGSMAAAAAQRARHEDAIELCGQLLIYPCVDAQCQRHSMAAYADVPPFKAHSTHDVWETYLGRSPSSGVPRYAAPIDGNLSDLATAYVDLLHDQGLAYAKAMQLQGIDVELNEVKGAIHGFDLLVTQSGVSKAAMESRIRFLRQIFSS
jgi:acetyl esterase